MRWILGSEENEDDLERIGKDRKIGITQFELVTNCHRLSCFYTLRSTSLFAI